MGKLTSRTEELANPREAALVHIYSHGGDWGALYIQIEIETILAVAQYNREGGFAETSLQGPPTAKRLWYIVRGAGVHRPGRPTNLPL
jgi:hypothetical protein